MLVTGLVRSGDDQPPVLGPHFGPGFDEHRQALDRIDPPEEKRRPGPAFRGAFGARCGRGQVDPIGDGDDPAREPDGAQVCGLGVAGRVQSCGPLEVAPLVEPPGHLLLQALVADRPGLEHAPCADDTRDGGGGRQLGRTVVVRQPQAVVVDQVGRESSNRFSERPGHPADPRGAWQEFGVRRRPVRRPQPNLDAVIAKRIGELRNRERRPAVSGPQAGGGDQDPHRAASGRRRVTPPRRRWSGAVGAPALASRPGDPRACSKPIATRSRPGGPRRRCR